MKSRVTQPKQEIKAQVKESAEVLKAILRCCVVIIVLLVINTLLLLSIGTQPRSTNESSNGTNQPSNTDSSLAKMTEVRAAEIANNTAGETKIVLVCRSSCHWCAEFTPIVNQAIDEFNLDALYLDLAKIIDFSGRGIIDQASYNAMLNFNTIDELADYMDENFSATPMLLVVRDGKMVDARTGYSDFAALSLFLEKNGFVKN